MFGLILIGIPIVVGAGYYVGLKKGEDKGYNAGLESQQTKIKDLQTDIKNKPSFFEEYSQVQTDYNNLVKDYNSLLEDANTPQYQPRQAINCTSMTYGTYSNFTSTNCY